jgi:hypothetical protein
MRVRAHPRVLRKEGSRKERRARVQSVEHEKRRVDSVEKERVHVLGCLIICLIPNLSPLSFPSPPNAAILRDL